MTQVPGYPEVQDAMLISEDDCNPDSRTCREWLAAEHQPLPPELSPVGAPADRH